MLEPKPVLYQSEHHADARCTETEMPVDLLTEIPADQRTDKGTDVDSHVVDGKPRIAPCPPLGIQFPNQRTHIGFEQPRTDDDENKALVKGELEKFQGLKGQPDPLDLYESIQVLDGRIILCELGLPIWDIKKEDLREGVEVMMASTFLFEAEGASMVFSY